MVLIPLPIYFAIGLFTGFILAIPVGPIGVLCIRKTLTGGIKEGIIVGLGGATVDMIYSSIAVFGMSFIINKLEDHRTLIILAGALILLIVAFKVFRTKKQVTPLIINKREHFKSYFSIVLIALTNPFPIFAFIAVFASFGLGEIVAASAFSISSGVFFGSLLWFVMLNTGVSLFKNKISLDGIKWVNKLAGVLIMSSVIISLVSLI